VIEIEARPSELEDLRLRRRARLVSGPQGPRVVLDGRPTLVLCSSNYLGLADHPRVRQAAADAALRWGTGAGASRLTSGTMTIHRRLEERLAGFLHQQAALLFGSGYLASLGVLAALARPGEVVFCDEHNQRSLGDGCRLSGAELFFYHHLDLDHLRWGIARAEGRGTLIVTESTFGLDGDAAPLAELVELAQRHRLRLAVDEGHALGAVGPEGRGAVAQAGLHDQVDVILGTLGHALASYGGFAAGDRRLIEHLLSASRTLSSSVAAAPPAAAAALAALEQLETRPQLVSKLASNSALLRHQLERRGFLFTHPPSQILSILIGEAGAVAQIFDSALQRGVLVETVSPPAVPGIASRLRMTATASHHPRELVDAADALTESIRAAGFEPGSGSVPYAEPEDRSPRIFDLEAA
jgi:8-amino-7-oxononanoate synthase